jgi:hypothetical protein
MAATRPADLSWQWRQGPLAAFRVQCHLPLLPVNVIQSKCGDLNGVQSETRECRQDRIIALTNAAAQSQISNVRCTCAAERYLGKAARRQRFAPGMQPERYGLNFPTILTDSAGTSATPVRNRSNVGGPWVHHVFFAAKCLLDRELYAERVMQKWAKK